MPPTTPNPRTQGSSPRLSRSAALGSLAWNEEGLVAAIVQDADTRRVLMLGWMDRQALGATLETGEVHFWSRSRGQLWKKGETSGNTLGLIAVSADCDGDALLVEARPNGPTCHTGSDTCWDDGPLGEGFARLEQLWSTVQSRAADRPPDSYTARLLDAGPDLVARKLIEEATEVALAAKDHAHGTADDRRVAEEVADVIYHLLVVTAERGIDPRLALDVLAERAQPPTPG